MVLNLRVLSARNYWCFSFLIFFFVNVTAQTKVSNGNGDWSNANTWSPAGVPASTDNVTIRSNHVVYIDGNYACNNLTIGDGAAAQLRFSNGFFSFAAGRNFTVNANLTVNNSATFDVYSGINNHSLFLRGNFTNNGSVDFRGSFSLFPLSNSIADIFFIRNGNQNLSGTGVLTRLNQITLNMGNAYTNILDVSTSSFDVSSDFLTLLNGTFKYATTSAINITPFTANVTIGASSGFWMSANNSNAFMLNGISLQGKLSVSGGVLNIGDAANENLLYTNGTFSITGGVLNVAGRLSGTANTSVCQFNMSGGNLHVPTLGSTHTTFSPFQIASGGSVFNMSGGTIRIRREGGTGNQNLGYVNLAGSGSVSDGTLEINPTLNNQTIKINSSAQIGNLWVNNSTASASLITNPLNVVKDVIITSGLYHTNNLNTILGGNWQNNGGAFTPGNAMVTFSSTTAQSIFKAGGETFNNLTFTGSGVKTFSSSVIANGNVLINTNSLVDVSSSNHAFVVRRNFTNNGTFIAQSGAVNLNGTTQQNIGGTSVTSFYDLSLNNNAGALLTVNVNLINALTLSNGTFNSNGFLTMVSTATNTARVNPITGTGDIIGNVTVQRFVPGGATGWVLLGTPLSSALTLNDWDDDIFISCPTCPDGDAANFLSIYTYDETAAGPYDNAASYVPLNTINDPIITNKGYWVYLGDGQYTTNNITIDVTGTLRKKNQTIPLSYTSNTSVADDGWNLIHNPYPSAISWTALKGTTANIDDAIYVYNADLNSGTGGNSTYINGISSPAVGSGGIGDVIPMCQGFYVHSTGATALNVTEAIKVSGNPVFLKQTNSQANVSLMRLKMNGPYGFNDECVLYIQPGATSNFDSHFDAIKMSGQNPWAPTLALAENNTVFQVNGISPVNGTYTTSLKALTGYAGTYTISASDIGTFPAGTCLNLYDKFTSVSTDLKNNSYVFNLADTTSVSRFILSVTLNTLNVVANTKQPTCSNTNGGEISVKGTNTGPWNYYWRDSNFNLVQTTLNKTTADTLYTLNSGVYQVEINSVGLCDNNVSSYTIHKQIPAYASFESIDTSYLNQNTSIQFNNTSLNYVSASWNFGDNLGVSNAFSPLYQYTNSGKYNVTLVVSGATGCKDTVSKTIVVSNEPVSINEMAKKHLGLLVKSFPQNKFIIEKELAENSSLAYLVFDGLGREITSEKAHNVNKIFITLNLNKEVGGIYFVKLSINNTETVIKLPVNH